MKKYILALFLIATVLSFGQTRKYALAEVDSGQTKVDSVQVPDGYWLSQINFPTLATGTDAYSFEIASFLEGTLSWKEYWYQGEKYSVTIKSAGECIDGTAPPSNWGVEWFKLVLDTEQDSTVTLEFTFELKR